MIVYRHGGNPPLAAGLFIAQKSDRGQELTQRLAWWPAAVNPTPDNIERVVNELVLARESDDAVVTRGEILKLFGVETFRDEGQEPRDRHALPGVWKR